MIEPLPKPVRDYLHEFGLACIYVTPAGRIGVTRDLADAGAIAAALWTKDAATAHAVVRAIGALRSPASVEAATAEVLAAAQRLDVVLSEHSVVVARARAAIDRLGARLSTANANGDLKEFNRAYRAYRLGCLQRGERAMDYGAARVKLRALLAGAAAGAPLADVVRRVFER